MPDIYYSIYEEYYNKDKLIDVIFVVDVNATHKKWIIVSTQCMKLSYCNTFPNQASSRPCQWNICKANVNSSMLPAYFISKWSPQSDNSWYRLVTYAMDYLLTKYDTLYKYEMCSLNGLYINIMLHIIMKHKRWGEGFIFRHYPAGNLARHFLGDRWYWKLNRDFHHSWKLSPISTILS